MPGVAGTNHPDYASELTEISSLAPYLLTIGEGPTPGPGDITPPDGKDAAL